MWCKTQRGIESEIQFQAGNCSEKVTAIPSCLRWTSPVTGLGYSTVHVLEYPSGTPCLGSRSPFSAAGCRRRVRASEHGRVSVVGHFATICIIVIPVGFVRLYCELGRVKTRVFASFREVHETGAIASYSILRRNQNQILLPFAPKTENCVSLTAFCEQLNLEFNEIRCGRLSCHRGRSSSISH